jgi:archaellum component FlaC
MQDEMQRALGRLEGRFDSFEQQLDSVKALVEGNAKAAKDVAQKVERLEMTHARVTGAVAAVAAIFGAFSSWIVKKIGVMV